MGHHPGLALLAALHSRSVHSRLRSRHRLTRTFRVAQCDSKIALLTSEWTQATCGSGDSDGSPAQARPLAARSAMGRAGDAELAFTFSEHAGGLAPGFLCCAGLLDSFDRLSRRQGA